MSNLTALENMALTIALGQIDRGETVPPNTTALLVWALARIEGRPLSPHVRRLHDAQSVK